MRNERKPKLPLVSPNDIGEVRLAAAFADIEPGLSTLQRDTLSALYHAPNHAMPVDEKGQYSNVINAFGKVGGRLSRRLGCQPEGGYHLLWIADQGRNQTNGALEWRMRSNFAKVLGSLGW